MNMPGFSDIHFHKMIEHVRYVYCAASVNFEALRNKPLGESAVQA